MKRVMALLSGGMDSTALVARSRALGLETLAVSISYGQRHSVELKSAIAVAKHYGIYHEILAVPESVLFSSKSSQTDPSVAVPEGHYAAENMKSTVVPNRNMLLMAMAAARAIEYGCDTLGIAVHAGDHEIYPDCREEFISAMRQAFLLCDWNVLNLWAPFQKASKADIVRYGIDDGAPFHLTWTCYKGGEKHCGRCGTCVERLEAFHFAGVNDIVEYEDTEFWKTQVKA